MTAGQSVYINKLWHYLSNSVLLGIMNNFYRESNKNYAVEVTSSLFIDIIARVHNWLQSLHNKWQNVERI